MERTLKTFIKKTRKGQVRKVVREHYLRDDILTEPDGGWGEGECIVIDTNIVLHQLDFLDQTTSQGILQNVIILQTVLDEVKHNKLQYFNRLKKMVQAVGRRLFVFANEHFADTYITALPGESPNDRNDRAIRRAASWFQSQLAGERKVTLVTNDKDNKQRATEQGIASATIYEFAKARKFAQSYLDTIASGADTDVEGGGTGGGPGDSIYPEHLSAQDIQDGVREGRFVVGTLHMNRDNATEGSVMISDSSKSEGDGQIGEHKVEAVTSLLVSGRLNLNRAMDMDRVIVEVLPKDQWRGPKMTIVEELEEGEGEGGEGGEAEGGGEATLRPAAKVVGIEKRAWRPYCGSIEAPMNPRDKTVLFAPVSKSIPKVRIQTKQAEELLSKRIVVAIDAWHATSKYPTGHYVRTIGKAGDIDCESEVILLEHEVCIREFAPNAFKELPKVGPNGEWDPSPEDLKGRVDLREGYRVCSIDPPGCKDIDDALHVRPLGNGRTEVGVHIADVTHFVHPNSTLDEEARFRGTSVYLVQKRIDMLPSLLTTDLCSLRGKVDRLAFSVIWTLDDDAEIVDVKFHRSVIRSVAAMTYGQAQGIIDDETDNTELAQDLRKMREITRKLRARRTAAGALTLASPEVRFELDSETHDPIDVRAYELKETNAMVEEMMLLANCTVAKHIHQHFPHCSMLRRHPSPPQSNFEPLRKVAEALGFKLESQSNKSLAASLDLMHVPGNPMANKLLRILATRAMSQAVYFASGDVSSSADFLHYGLAAPTYTHFTSPIRRYADVVVHRLLAASIGLSGLPDDLNNTAGVKEVANGINHRHRMAQFAGRASTELHAHVFFKDKVSEEQAFVMRLRRNGVIVLIPKYGLEVPVFLSKKGEPCRYKLSADGMALSADNKHIRVLDRLPVRLSVETHGNHRTNLKVELVEGSSATLETSTVESGEGAAGKVESGGKKGGAKRASEDGGGGGTPKKKAKKGK